MALTLVFLFLPGLKKNEGQNEGFGLNPRFLFFTLVEKRGKRGFFQPWP